MTDASWIKNKPYYDLGNDTTFDFGNIPGTQDKVFFYPGDVVTIKQEIPNKPTMLVVKKQTMTIRDGDTKQQILRGIVCRWWTNDGTLQEALFSSKDLIKLNV